jgi:hypothetical protein
MATDKYNVEIVDSDGNSSRLVLPGFALDSTQEKLIKSVQALGKMNPKQAEAYEKLLAATNDAAKAGKSASEKQTEELEKVLNVSADKQVKALKSFRGEFADRVGKDMRDTFVSGGNILTAAIKTATVGLAAGAGLLYKTFMDTSDAFRSLAQSGLGGAGASGTEAQDAVAELTRLGMSAGEAAGLLTSFGQASAMLGKANFSKFISGIANAGSFAANLGLTLEEAAEFAAEEVSIRQRGLAQDFQLTAMNRQTVEESIKQTQRFSSVMGRSMKDINDSKKDFFQDNANIDALMMRFSGARGERLNAELNLMIGAAAAIPGAYESLTKGLLNAAAAPIPILDPFLQSIADLGPLVGNLYQNTLDISQQIQTGQLDGEGAIKAINRSLLAIDNATVTALQYDAQSGNAAAAMVISARTAAAKSAADQEKAFKKVAVANDAMVTAGVNFQNQLNRISGAFTTVRNNVLGQFAEPLTKMLDQFALSGDELKENNKQRRAEIDKELKAGKISPEEAKARTAALRQKSVTETVSDGLSKIADSFMKKFFPNINAAGDGVGTFVDMVVTKVNEIMTGIDTFINSLEGDTFGAKIYDALGKGLVILFEAGVTLAWSFAKNVIAEHWGKILTYVMVLMTAAVAKTFVLSAVSAFAAKQIMGSGRTAASAVSTAGNALAAVIRRVAGQISAAGGAGGVPIVGGDDSKGGKKGGILSRILGKASIIGIGTSILGGVAANELSNRGHTKTAAAVDTAAMVAGGASMGAMIGAPFAGIGAVPGAAIGGAIGGGAALALGMYQNWNTWFGSSDAEAAIAEKGQEAIEGMDATGMAAMAMDPAHIKAVGAALKDFNNVSVTNIAAGLTEFNPKLEQMFSVINSIKTAFVDNVNIRLQRLLTIITGLNVEGLKLPITTQYLGELAEKITSMPIDKIEKLATTFSALTLALRDFASLTSSNFFTRAFDAFTGKQDDTENIIKVLNNFADKVDSEKLLKAAQATMAFNAGMAGYAAVPTEPARTSPTGQQQSPADQVNTTANTMQYNNPYNKMRDIESELIRLNAHIKNSVIPALTGIKDNTGE